ncbi:hypothetical protein RHMOL_Rhmol11G0083900 [Rhododendron molle]|uniref:Uncharacterized protein n=1 Tax=Rhododendron molle TaxID=49168 RepID=A0ACC0LPX1_RHOML|nr:hypothetical protein RHMOL_Rhmol11G0083900 [Rhododendron molle]
MEEKSWHPVPSDNGNFEVARLLREIPPAHYTFKIKSFSLLSQLLLDAKQKNFESSVFEASDFKWKLSLYPHGDKERNGEGHISLYLVIADRHNLPLGWEVNVNFKLFVFDQIQDKYMTVQGTNCFSAPSYSWGWSSVLSLTDLHDASKGFLVDNSLIIEANVSAISTVKNFSK